MRCMNLDSASFKGLGGFFCFVLFFWPCTFKKKKKKEEMFRGTQGARRQRAMGGHGRNEQDWWAWHLALRRLSDQ